VTKGDLCSLCRALATRCFVGQCSPRGFELAPLSGRSRSVFRSGDPPASPAGDLLFFPQGVSVIGSGPGRGRLSLYRFLAVFASGFCLEQLPPPQGPLFHLVEGACVVSSCCVLGPSSRLLAVSFPRAEDLLFFFPSFLVCLPRLGVGVTAYLPQAHLFLPLFLSFLPLSSVAYVTCAPAGVFALRPRVLSGHLPQGPF
jgi:hypothetical protein